MRILMFLAILLVLPFVLRILARIAIFLFLRTAGRGIAKEVGKAAVDRLPDAIHLEPRERPSWKDAAAITSLTAPLEAEGFFNAGHFTIVEIAGVSLQFFVDTERNAYSVVYEHEAAGIFLDLVTLYEDGASLTATTSKHVALDPRPGHEKLRAPGASASELLRRFFAERPSKPMRPMGRELLPGYFEKAWADEIEWRRSRGGATVREVAAVATARMRRGGHA